MELSEAEMDYIARCIDLGRSDQQASAILPPNERDELLRKFGGRRN